VSKRALTATDPEGGTEPVVGSRVRSTAAAGQAARRRRQPGLLEPRNYNGGSASGEIREEEPSGGILADEAPRFPGSRASPGDSGAPRRRGDPACARSTADSSPVPVSFIGRGISSVKRQVKWKAKTRSRDANVPVVRSTERLSRCNTRLRGPGLRRVEGHSDRTSQAGRHNSDGACSRGSTAESSPLSNSAT